MKKFKNEMNITILGTFLVTLLLGMVVFGVLPSVLASFQSDYSLVTTRSDGYCSVNLSNRCVETGNTCRVQGTAEKPKACADWLDPTNIDYCNCLYKP